MKYKTIKTLLILLTGIVSFLLPSRANPQSELLPLEYSRFIQERMNSCVIYPPEARLKGWEGIAKVKFTINRDGRIKEIDIAQSSGYPLLDAAAILAVRDASPYPFPQNYPEEELEIIIPVSYEQDKPLEINKLQEMVLREGASLAEPIKLPEAGVESAQEKPSVPAYKKALTTLEEIKKAPSSPLIPERTALHKQEAPQEKSLLWTEELSYFIDLALKNNQPTKVAHEEVELAQLKVTEAQRNLFPSLKISRYNTTGVATTLDYEEQETKLEATQPIFYGGKLGDTIKQAKVNLEITKKNYDRLKLDVVQKTEAAYYNLVAARMNLGLKETLLQEAKEMLEKIEELSAAGMTIPLEVTGSRSWFAHIQLQADSIKQDLFMAELTFKQVLNSKEIPEIGIQELPEARKLNIDLSTCVETAFQYRPEIYLSELLVKFNDYGQKIKASESGGFSVDLTGSYGKYEGRNKTEPWPPTSTNWFAGIKVSKPWGGSTINTSYNKEETQPRKGQTSATESKTLSAELNVLDNIKSLSEKKRSDIDMHRSVSDFDETLKTINFEVQDAFLNYQKAILQLNTAKTETEFRRNEVDLTKVRAMVGEVSLSSTMEGLFTLSEAQSKYIQALANYHISLANLKKATGYGIKI